MQTGDDMSYFARRAEQEHRAADASQDLIAARLHAELARAYEDRSAPAHSTIRVAAAG